MFRNLFVFTKYLERSVHNGVIFLGGWGVLLALVAEHWWAFLLENGWRVARSFESDMFEMLGSPKNIKFGFTI